MSVQPGALPEGATLPAHVPWALVHDFDISSDTRLTGDPHLAALALHSAAPEIFWSPRYGGCWMVRSLEAAREVSQSPALFISGGSEVVQIPVGLDPPRHAPFRNVIGAAFAPRLMQELVPSITALCNRLIDDELARQDGRCEIVGSITSRLPVWVFMDLAGLPLDQFDYLRGLTLAFLREADEAKRQPIIEQILEATASVVRARQARREKDMISRLLDSTIDGRPITFDEMQSICLFFVLAGLDTVTSALGFGFHYLASDPELQQQLRDRPELIDIAAEELLRIGAPSSVIRHVATDMEFRGVAMRQGDRVHILYPAANLDPCVFADPLKVDLQQTEPTVAFGTGPHRCLGSHLARIEMRILYREWLRRVPTFTLDPERPARYHTGLVWGVSELHLKWRAA